MAKFFLPPKSLSQCQPVVVKGFELKIGCWIWIKVVSNFESYISLILRIVFLLQYRDKKKFNLQKNKCYMNFSPPYPAQEPKLRPWQALQTVELNIRCAHKTTSLHPSAESFTSEVIHEDALPVSLELLNITFHVCNKLVCIRVHHVHGLPVSTFIPLHSMMIV